MKFLKRTIFVVELCLSSNDAGQIKIVCKNDCKRWRRMIHYTYTVSLKGQKGCETNVDLRHTKRDSRLHRIRAHVAIWLIDVKKKRVLQLARGRARAIFSTYLLSAKPIERVHVWLAHNIIYLCVRFDRKQCSWVPRQRTFVIAVIDLCGALSVGYWLSNRSLGHLKCRLRSRPTGDR